MGRGGIPSSGQLQGGPVLPSPGSAGLSRAWATRWTDRVWLGPLWPRQTSRVPQQLGAGPAEPGCARGWRRGPSPSARLERVTTMLRAWARPPGSTWRRPLPGGQSRCRPLAGSGRVTGRCHGGRQHVAPQRVCGCRVPSAGARHPGTAVPCISSLSWWFTGERFRRFPVPGVAGVLPSPPRYFRSVPFLFRNTILHRSELGSTDPLFHHDAHTSRLKRSGRAGSGSFRPPACIMLLLRPGAQASALDTPAPGASL